MAPIWKCGACHCIGIAHPLGTIARRRPYRSCMAGMAPPFRGMTASGPASPIRARVTRLP
jgi:hypothetical protein